jgi:hypothetical protein
LPDFRNQFFCFGVHFWTSRVFLSVAMLCLSI